MFNKCTKDPPLVLALVSQLQMLFLEDSWTRQTEQACVLPIIFHECVLWLELANCSFCLEYTNGLIRLCWHVSF